MLSSARISLAALLLLCATLCQAQPESLPQHLELGRQLLASLKPENTSYRHKGWVRWPGDLFTNEHLAYTDCSGLINSLLERIGNPQLDRLKSASSRGIPKARDYYRQIAAGNGFLRIETIQEALPGDILAIEYPRDSENTGHVMLIDAVPVQRATASAPLIDNTMQWEIAVIDSSSSPHGRQDNRYGENGDKRSGVGRGVIRIYSDRDGRPVGYSWSTLSVSKYQDESNKPLAIGRLR